MSRSIALLLALGAVADELHKVPFRFRPATPATSVHLAGEFNAWSKDACPLVRARDGTWAIDLELSPGIYAYKIVVDGERWQEDPKARERRSDGMGGFNSLVAVGNIERALARFEPPAWVPDAIGYQILPERFCDGDAANNPRGCAPWGSRPEFGNFMGGDLAGVEKRLDHLAALGVTCVYLNPIFSSSANHGYSVDDYRTVAGWLGGDAALASLAQALHERGMKLVLDGVFNHSSTQLFAFQEAKRLGPASPYWGWYDIEGIPVRTDPPNYACWSGHASLPALETDNEEVRRYLFGAVKHWHETVGIDGWRLDAVTDIEHTFFEALSREVEGIDPEAWLLGEIWGDPWPWLQGDELDGATNYRFRDAVLKGVIERSVDAVELDARLRGIQADIPAKAVLSMMNILGSHDTERLATLSRKAAGDAGSARVRQAFLLLFTYPGLPCVYYGDEIGLEGGADPECRRCFPWDEADWDRVLFERVVLLAGLRQEQEALRGPQWRTLRVESTVLVVARGSGSSAVAFALNLGDEPVEIVLPPDKVGWQRGQEVRERLLEIGLGEGVWKVKGSAFRFTLPPLSSAVFTP